MSTFQQKYKDKIITFGNTKESRFIRTKEREESRKRQRAENFNNSRNIPTSTRTENEKMQSNHVVKDNLTRFMKWRAEQEKHRIEEIKKKQPFVVGIVHHKINSPIPSYRTINSNTTNKKVCNKTEPMSSTSLPRKITKATEKRLMNKNGTKEAIDQSSKSQKSLNNVQKTQEKQKIPFAPTAYKSKARTKLSRIPVFVGIGVKRISYTKISKSALSKNNVFILAKNDRRDEAVIYSPNVVLSCGKTNVRREQQSEYVFNLGHLKDESKKCSPVTQDKTQLDLKQIQLSATLKSIGNLPTVQQEGEMCETSDVQLDNEIFSINSNQVANESILKHPNNLTKIEASIKSTIKVDIDQNIISNEVLVNQEILLKPGLCINPKIDGINVYSPDEVEINAQRKLSFNSGEFDDVNLQHSELKDSINKNGSDVSSVKIHTATPLKHLDLDKCTNTLSSKACLTEQCTENESNKELSEDLILNITSTQLEAIAENTNSDIVKQEPHKCIYINNKKQPSEYNENTKVLRNKIIVVVQTPTPRKLIKKVNVQELNQKENKNPLVKTGNRSVAKVTVDHEKAENSKNCLDKVALNTNNDNRKYRRNIKSSEKDYCDYNSNRPATPTTPRIR